MSWVSYVAQMATSDQGATPTYSQRFKLTDRSAVLEGFQIGVFVVGTPILTAVKMELWTDKSDSMGQLIATSTTEHLSADLPEGFRILGFQFPRTPLRVGAYYRAAMRITGYTGTDTDYVGWRMTYPDPPYLDGITLETVKALTFPMDMAVFTSEAR